MAKTATAEKEAKKTTKKKATVKRLKNEERNIWFIVEVSCKGGNHRQIFGEQLQNRSIHGECA